MRKRSIPYLIIYVAWETRMRQSGARIFLNKRIYYLLVLKFKGKMSLDVIQRNEGDV